MSVQSRGRRGGKDAPGGKPVGKTSGGTAPPCGAEPSSRGKKSRKRPKALGPFAAAYWAGRLLNEIDWHMQQAWLLPARSTGASRRHCQAAYDILTDLPAVLRRAVAPSATEGLTDLILAKRDDWASLFEASPHLEAIDSAAGYLEYELSHEGAVIDPLALREFCWGNALAPVRELIEQLVRAVEASLDEIPRLVLALGRWVDRGLHPREVYRHMSRDLVDSPPPTPPGVSPFPDPGQGPAPAAEHAAPPDLSFSVRSRRARSPRRRGGSRTPAPAGPSWAFGETCRRPTEGFARPARLPSRRTSGWSTARPANN
jgi:hypothetical protein